MRSIIWCLAVGLAVGSAGCRAQGTETGAATSVGDAECKLIRHDVKGAVDTVRAPAGPTGCTVHAYRADSTQLDPR